MSYHHDLLRQARHLATKEPRRPSQASLRRAASSAFYALFHLLTDEASRRLVTGPGRTALRHTLGRSYQHREMKEAAKLFANRSGKLTPVLAGLTPHAELVRVAEAFVSLQEARHEADYDLRVRFTKQASAALVFEAEQAFVDWSVVRRTVQADAFLVALLVGRNLRL